MLEKYGDYRTITCDKCGQQETAYDYNSAFHESGWVFNPRAKKYVHLCRGCQSSSTRKAKFPFGIHYPL